MNELDVTGLAAALGSDNAPVLVDVREAWELDLARIEGALHIPMNDIPTRLEDLRRAAANRGVAVLCHSGVRSLRVVRFLDQQGFDPVFNVTGGIEAWSRQVDQNVPLY